MTNIFGPDGPGINPSVARPVAPQPTTNADTWFVPCVNGDPNTGTKIPSGWLNFITANLRRAIRGRGVAESVTDDDLLLKAIESADRAIVSVGGGTPLYNGLSAAGQHRLRSLLAGAGITIEEVETAPASGLFALRITSGAAPALTGWQALPIFPEAETANNLLSIVNNGNGTVTLAAGQSILFRGWEHVSTDSYTLAARTFATVANKVYHLRLRRQTGPALLDIADVGYNPTGLAEYDTAFDSTFDDLLAARIVTSVTNVPTIVPLANIARMTGRIEAAPRSIVYPSGAETNHYFDFTMALARTPRLALHSMDPPSGANDTDYSIHPMIVRREHIQVYSWSWHYAAGTSVANQSPGFAFELMER